MRSNFCILSALKHFNQKIRKILAHHASDFQVFQYFIECAQMSALKFFDLTSSVKKFVQNWEFYRDAGYPVIPRSVEPLPCHPSRLAE